MTKYLVIAALAASATTASAQNYYVNRLGNTTVITPVGPPAMAQPQLPYPMQSTLPMDDGTPAMQLQPLPSIQPIQPMRPMVIFGR